MLHPVVYGMGEGHSRRLCIRKSVPFALASAIKRTGLAKAVFGLKPLDSKGFLICVQIDLGSAILGTPTCGTEGRGFESR